MRRKIAAGNWKMNTSLESGKSLASEVINMAETELSSEVEMIICPPLTHLSEIQKMSEGYEQIECGAQNCYFEASGAFTGEVSVEMVAALGVKYIVCGHSERREIFHENDEIIAKKVKAILDGRLDPIFCCGEPLEIREQNKQDEFVSNQVEKALFNLSEAELKRTVIAYEPIWAIGTGLTASPEQAQEMHKSIRDLLATKFGETIAQSIPILYGGSVKPGNAKELFSCADVDGGLVGGASLKSRDFVDIAKSF